MRRLKPHRHILVTHHSLNSILHYLNYFKAVLIVAEAIFYQNLISHVLPHILNSLMPLNSKLMHRALLTNVNWNPHELFGYEFYFGNGEADVHEWLKRNAEMIAILLWTPYSTFKLAMHEIYDY